MYTANPSGQVLNAKLLNAQRIAGIANALASRRAWPRWISCTTTTSARAVDTTSAIPSTSTPCEPWRFHDTITIGAGTIGPGTMGAATG